MKRVWQIPAKILTGVFVSAMCAMPQAYTISAKPGVVNYIEGNAFLNGRPVSATSLKSTFLNANDTLSTDIGKAEVLLTPGVFLRIGQNSRIRMVAPSLTDTQVEFESGDAMVEVDDLVKDNNITVLAKGASIILQKPGLYRFATDPTPTASVIEGKAEVVMADRKVELGKGREVELAANLKTDKFDRKREDDLYAWSNVRSEYDAASSYQAAKNVTVNNYGGWGGLGFAGGYGPGWYWNSGFNSWSWLPMNGAFYSPFGYGFYGPGVLPYAPVVVAPLYGGGGGYVNGSGTKTAVVPISPKNPPAIGAAVRSPYANEVARTQVAQSFNYTGFRTASGAPAATFAGGRVSGAGVRMGGSSVSAARSGGSGFSGESRSAGSFAGTAHMSGGASVPAHK